MDWSTLLSPKRLCDPRAHQEDGRSPFQKDIDRIVFSSAFRRLQDKTQVHPLSKSDYVRTRLTHSIEVASVGRSLGTIVGSHIDPERKHEFGYIVQAACLAHDLGNPPFGHSGEEAMRSWFQKVDNKKIFDDITDSEIKDFEQFEGNAQGFRILTQLENHRWKGGLRLTHAVLGAYTKYPCSTEHIPIKGDVGGKKLASFKKKKNTLI